VRGAEDAIRYAADPVRRSACPRPDRTRVLAGDIAKDAPEGAKALPARAQSDFADGQVSVAQQCCSLLDAPREQVAVRWDAEGLFE